MINKYIIKVLNEKFSCYGSNEAMAKSIFLNICEKFTNTSNKEYRDYWSNLREEIMNGNYVIGVEG